MIKKNQCPICNNEELQIVIGIDWETKEIKHFIICDQCKKTIKEY